MSILTKQIRRFFIAGISAVFTDFSSYYVMLNFFNNDIAKTFSFILGSLVAFTINKYWTFEKFAKSFLELFKFGILYTTSLLANVLSNSTALDLTEMIFLSFIIATGVSTIINFLGQKFWVFR